VAKELVYVAANGDKLPMDLSLAMVKEACDAGVGLREWINAKYPTNAERDGTAFEQAMEQAGLFIGGNRAMGIRKTNFADILNPANEAAGSVITRDNVPASRILFPPAILSVIEDKLKVDYSESTAAINSMVAYEDSIQGTRFERPVLNFSKPEAARSAPVAQLSLPNSMLSITASDKPMVVPSWSLGMEISEQALQITSVDLVSLALGRQAEVERSERSFTQILALLQGDPDNGQAALSATEAKTLDASITTDGVLTQKAWVAWLSRNANKRRIDTIVTDLATAIAIENRTGKPVITGDNPNSKRIDTLFEVMNPHWPDRVRIFLTTDPNWPANTILGLDTRYGVHRVTSLSAQFSAIEQFVLKRSTAMRFDNGELLYRLFDEAFDVLTLTTA
jgi:hypothetical protein